MFMQKMPHDVKNDLLANNLVSKGNIFIAQKKSKVRILEDNLQENWQSKFQFYFTWESYTTLLFCFQKWTNKNTQQLSDRKYPFLFLANKNSLASGKPASPYYNLLNTLKKPKAISNSKCAAGMFILWD